MWSPASRLSTGETRRSGDDSGIEKTDEPLTDDSPPLDGKLAIDSLGTY